MLHNIRKQYLFGSLDEKNVLPDPFAQFQVWLQEAIKTEQPEPTAMTLSTVDENGQPHSRIVLLKEIASESFTFFTNYEGNKARQMAHNNRVAINFFWPGLERQVRIEGTASKISELLSNTYFKSRPLESQVGAWASPQSQTIHSADFLEKQYEYYCQKFGDEVPRPSHWGGYAVAPVLFEFWQGRPNRLHDRILYSKQPRGWEISRLAP